MDRVDVLLAMPHYLRTVRTVVYMLLLIHVNACAYYAVSLWEGIGTNAWVFNGVGNASVVTSLECSAESTHGGKRPTPSTRFRPCLFPCWMGGTF